MLVQAAPQQFLPDRRCTPGAGDETHIDVRVGERRLEGVFVEVAHRRHHRVCVARRDLECRQVGLAHGARPKSGELGEFDERARSRAVSENREQGLGQSRLNEDIERAATGARGGNHQLSTLARLFHLVASHDVDQLRRAFGQRPQGLAAHDGLRAAAADPPSQAAVGGDHGLVAGMRGGRRLAAHDRSKRARGARGLVLLQQIEYVVGYSVTPPALNAAQTLSDVTGMSMLVTPYGESASMTAFTYAAGEPTVGDSPTPLAPSG